MSKKRISISRKESNRRFQKGRPGTALPQNLPRMPMRGGWRM